MKKSSSQHIVADFLSNLACPGFIQDLPRESVQELQSKVAYLNGDFGAAIKDAGEAGMDVNDWLEAKEGWECSWPLVEEVLPSLPPDARVCEIGAGTGRESRRFGERLPGGTFHLVDKSARIINFLRDYFNGDPRFHFHLSDGVGLPFAKEGNFDLVFSHGTFIYQKLGIIYRLAREIGEALKPGGICAFTYIDIDTSQGWAYLEEQAQLNPDCFEYFPGQVIERIFAQAGMGVAERLWFHNYRYLILRKQPPASLSSAP